VTVIDDTDELHDEDDRPRMGDENDRLQIGLMAEEADVSEAYLERLRPKVRALLRRHWPKVERVAQALLEHKTLTAEAIDALIDTATTAQERAIAARIETVRQPLRDWYAAMHQDMEQAQGGDQPPSLVELAADASIRLKSTG
jgi:hypothetical protein